MQPHLQSSTYWRSVLAHTPMPDAIADLIKHSTDVGEIARSHPVMKPVATSAEFRSSFFLENDLHAGAKLTLHFTGTGSRSFLLPRQEGRLHPVHHHQASRDLLARFSIEPGSHEAKAIETTLEECEEPAAYGQIKKCATSLESMLEFHYIGPKNSRHPHCFDESRYGVAGAAV